MFEIKDQEEIVHGLDWERHHRELSRALVWSGVYVTHKFMSSGPNDKQNVQTKGEIPCNILQSTSKTVCKVEQMRGRWAKEDDETVLANWEPKVSVQGKGENNIWKYRSKKRLVVIRKKRSRE